MNQGLVHAFAEWTCRYADAAAASAHPCLSSHSLARAAPLDEPRNRGFAYLGQCGRRHSSCFRPGSMDASQPASIPSKKA